MGTKVVPAGSFPQAQPTLLSSIPQKGPYNGAVMVYSGHGSRLDPSSTLSSRPSTPFAGQSDSKSTINPMNRSGNLRNPIQAGKSATAPVLSMRSVLSPHSTQSPQNSSPRFNANPYATSKKSSTIANIHLNQSQSPPISNSHQVGNAHRLHAPPSSQSAPSQQIQNKATPESRGRSAIPTHPTPRALSLASIRSEPHAPRSGRVHFDEAQIVRNKRAHSDADRPTNRRPSPPTSILKKSASTQSIRSISVGFGEPDSQSIASRETSGGAKGWRPVFAHPHYASLKPTVEEAEEEAPPATQDIEGSATEPVASSNATNTPHIKATRYRKNKPLQGPDMQTKADATTRPDRSERVKSGCSFDDGCVVCLFIDMYASSSTENTIV